MEIRYLNGMTKAQFLEQCIEIADGLNPNWQQDIFHLDNFVPSIVWNTACDSRGFALSAIGGKFFEEALQLTPYYIECKFMYSGDILRLSKLMPWPYTSSKYEGSLITRIGIYSSEVAVWAALYDNDLELLLKAYSRE